MGDLSVDAAGLSSAATSSEHIAEVLSAPTDGAVSGSQPSHAGVSALDLEIATMRERQAGRVAGQARDMATGASAYNSTDGDSAAHLSVTV